MKLELSPDEINAIIQVLGELPTKSMAYPLMMKIKAQGESEFEAQKLVLKSEMPNSAPKE